MILGLKRRLISRFLRSAPFKRSEKLNIQKIRRCLEDGMLFCPDWFTAPCTAEVLMFNFKHDFSHYDICPLTKNLFKGEVSEDGDHIIFHVSPNVLAEAVLTDIHEHAENYGKNQAMENKTYFNGKEYVDIPKNENVVVKLCTQDMSHPFQAVDLRRMMCSRFVTNITKLFNENVTSIMYLHDWMQIMGDQKALKVWQECRNICVGDHEKMYQRLGIKFDVTSAESHYTEQTNQIISMAKEKNILGISPEVAAIVDDFNKYSPDRLICVCRYGDFFPQYPDNLESIVKNVRPDQPGSIEIVRIGELISSEKNSPSISDTLDELMISKASIMLKHKLGEDCESLSDVSDKLSISRFAMQHFKSIKYNLLILNLGNFHKAFNGRDGVTLQYTHARLCRLITLYSDDYSFESVDFNLLTEEDCAVQLVQHLARYPEVLIQCYMELEARHLVNYLNYLLKLERLAYKELLVFNQPKNIRDARLTLFKCTRQVLANGMNILGIQPLGKI